MTSNEQQVASINPVLLRRAPAPPNNREAFPENFDTVRFAINRDDNEFAMFETPVKASSDDDFNFEKLHEELGRPILLAMNERKALKEQKEQPLIVL
jgi:hypothetical protein